MNNNLKIEKQPITKTPKILKTQHTYKQSPIKHPLRNQKTKTH